MNRPWLVTVMILLLGTSLSALPARAHAAPLAQDDPVTQCAEGVQLFIDGQYAEALPLLEAGFAGREATTFADPDDLGVCALVLGRLRNNTGDRAGALEAYAVALEVFQDSGNRPFEGMTIHNIAVVYHNQMHHAEALEYYQQALAISREVGDQVSEATTLNSIGDVYQAQGSYFKALEAFHQALAVLRDLGDRADERTILSNIAGVHLDQGRYAEALEFYLQALIIHREVGDRAGEGTTLNDIGETYYSKGRYAEALEFCQQALAILREVGDRAGEGRTLNNIGLVYHSQGRYVEALEFYQQALAIRREVGDRLGEGTTLNNIGGVYNEQGRYAKALEFYQQAMIILQEVGNRAREGSMLNNIGQIYYAQGLYAEALEFYRQALAIRREVGDRAGEGRTLDNIGQVHHAQGRYAEALEHYQQALSIRLEVGDRIGEGTTLNNIGGLYHSQGRYAEALGSYRKSLAINREVGDQVGEAATLNNIGGVYQHQGDIDQALAHYEQALAISREVGDRAGEGNALGNIGQVHHDQGRYAEALEHYQQALSIRREVGDRIGEGRVLNNIGAVYDDQGRYAEALEGYQQALAISREVGDRAGEAATLNNIGGVYQQQGDIDQALAHYEQAMGVFESLRAIAGSEAGRAAFIAKYVSLYDRAVGLYHEQDQDTQAFHTSERGRARAFLDSLATGHVELSDDTAADLLAREQAAYAAYQAAQDELVHARAQQPPDTLLIADLETQLAAVEKEHVAVLATIEARGDELATLIPDRSTVLEVTQVQALLDDQTTLVAYHILGDEGALAFVITREGLSVVDLPDATPNNLSTALMDLYQWSSLEDPHPLSLHNLHAWLVAPLAEHLHTPLVGIIPHQLLHYVPFAALAGGETYFGQEHILFTFPSASALPFIQDNARATASTESIVLGNPDAPGLQPLSHAAGEAEAIASVLGVPAYLRAEASETRLRSSVEDAGTVHLAAHGSFNPVAPLYSAIHLTPGGENDGLLEAHEVYGLDLKATDLVVLSACQTNVGELSAGDELVGLTRAFFFAGTPTVIASLWAVDDAATEELMVAFYQHLRAGMGKAEALQAAQAEVRETSPSPFYWAAFVLNGDPGWEELPSTSLPQPTVMPTSGPMEGEGGGICLLAAALPVVLVGLWVVQRWWKVR